jgi:hypothetical protein
VDLAKIERQLAEASSAHMAGKPDDLIDVLIQLSTSARAAELLAALRADRPRLEAAASRSYVHANGFLKIVLLAGAEFKLRLHLWLSTIANPAERDEDIHNHRWDFVSHVMAGSYRHQQFAPDDGGLPYYRYSYEPVGSSGSFSLRHQGMQGLSCVSDETIEAGCTYMLRTEALHRVMGEPSRPTATLMLQAAAMRPVTDIYTPVPLGQTRIVPVERLAATTLEHHLAHFAATCLHDTC